MLGQQRRKRYRAPSESEISNLSRNQFPSIIAQSCREKGTHSVSQLREIYARVNRSTESNVGLSKRDLCTTLGNQLQVDVTPISIDEIPPQYIDPFSNQPLLDPYFANDDFNYNGSTLQYFIGLTAGTNKPPRNPNTDAELTRWNFNAKLAARVQEYLEQHGIPYNAQLLSNNETKIPEQTAAYTSMEDNRQMVRERNLDVNELVWIANLGDPTVPHISQLPSGRKPYMITDVDPVLAVVDTRQAPHATIEIHDPNASVFRTYEAVDECRQMGPESYNECVAVINEYSNWLLLKEWELTQSPKIIQELQDALIQSNPPIRQQAYAAPAFPLSIYPSYIA